MCAGAGPKQTMAERLSAKLPKSVQREQEDAHEFFNFLVDATHEELLRLRTANAEMLGKDGAELCCLDLFLSCFHNVGLTKHSHGLL